MQYLSERLRATKGEAPDATASARESLVAQQRSRLLAATEQLLAERGSAGTTIERIAKRARVSSGTFYEHFASKEEAFVAALDLAVEEERALIAAAVPSGLGWPEQVREGLRALLAAIAARPARAAMCLVESPNGGPALLGRYEEALDECVAKLGEGRLADAAAAGLPEALEETTAAGLAWLLRERLETDGAAGIEELLPRLVDVALTPYLGSAGALHLASTAEAG